MGDQPGLLGHAVRFEIFGNKAWTMTAWKDEASLTAFVRSPAHRAAVRRLHNRAVFEVPEILAGLLAQAQQQVGQFPAGAASGAELAHHLAAPKEPSTCPIG
jgi:heme-degrading monooxygenase HmoA